MENQPEKAASPLVFAVNQQRFELSTVDPSTTLLHFLRHHTPFKSAKLGCGEGNYFIFLKSMTWVCLLFMEIMDFLSFFFVNCLQLACVSTYYAL